MNIPINPSIDISAWNLKPKGDEVFLGEDSVCLELVATNGQAVNLWFGSGSLSDMGDIIDELNRMHLHLASIK